MNRNQNENDNPTFSLKTGNHAFIKNKKPIHKQKNNKQAKDWEDDAELPSHITIVPFSPIKTGSFP